MSHSIPQWLRTQFDRLELDAPRMNSMGMFTQMRTKVQAYFMRFDDEPVAVVDEADDGMFIEIIHGDDGTPLKMGDKLYARGTGDSLSTHLANLEALLHRALPYLSDSPDLVQQGADALAGEVRAILAAEQPYRLLTAGDVIEATDEYLHDNAMTWEVVGPGVFAGMKYIPGGLLPVRRLVVECSHEWVDGRNEIIQSGEFCRKCLAVRAGNETTDKVTGDIQ